MKVFSTEEGFLVRLERGEEIHASLIRFAADEGLKGAVVQGIGAIMNAELGYFNVDRRAYDRRELDESTELLSLLGNICHIDGRPFLHAHVVLMKSDFTVAGGHLFKGDISVTGEFSIRDGDLNLTRCMEPAVGLPLLEPGP